MPTKWNRGVRETGKLKVFNKGGGWSAAVDAAIGSFNNLGLGVQLVKESSEDAANVVVTLSNGSETYSLEINKLPRSLNRSLLHGSLLHGLTSGTLVTV